MGEERTGGRGALWAVVVAVLLLAVAGGAVFLLRPATPGEETRALESAFHRLRDAILQGDDEAFFRMHSRAAREDAIRTLPVIRSQYLGSPPQEREAFHELYQVTAEEFLSGEPRELMVRILPWMSGWRERREVFRVSRVRDVRVLPVIAHQQHVMDGDVPLSIDARVVMQAEHIQRPQHRRRPRIHCLAGLAPGKLKGAVLGLAVSGAEQPSQVLVLA